MIEGEDTGIAGFFLLELFELEPVKLNLIRGFLASHLPGTPLEFTLYSRSNCPLCEAMEDELRPFIVEYRIVVKRQYIDNEPALEKLYGSQVPVLMLNDEILCHYFLDADILHKALTDKAG